MKKVILINPPTADDQVWVREGRCQQWDIWGAPFPPLSLALISTQLVKSGFGTLIVDSGPQGRNMEETLKVCTEFAPGLAIISTATPTIENDLNLFLSELKKRAPAIKTAAIGIHVTALCGDVLSKYPALDYVIAGEPEITARELAEALGGGADLGSVKGLAFRNAAGIVKTAERGFLEDLDSLGFPDWAKINFEHYKLPIKNKKFSLISFARGCPYRCKYCATHVYNGPAFRKRSIESLIAEIKFNIDSFGVRDFLFWTEQITIDRRYLEAFLDALAMNGLEREIRWVCNSRTDFVDAAILEKMKNFGCWQIAFGFEFGEDAILELVEKGGGASVEQSRRAAELASGAGLAVDGHFILGYPGEDKASMQATVDLACSMPLTFAHFYMAVPFPGSRLYSEALENKWIEKENWGRLNQDIVSVSTGKLSVKDIEFYRKKAYKSFYFRFRTALRILSIPETPAEYFNLLRISLRFLKTSLFPA